MGDLIEKLPLTSKDVNEDRLEALRELFPEAFKEGTIDWPTLQRSLGEWIDPEKERFGLNWPGKANCMKVIQQASIGTLLPARNKSVNFDTTDNLIIEGDNLEVLKLLQKSYYGQIKMIYVDPPYNTGNEFIYPDNFQEGLQEYLRYSGQVSAEGLKLSANTERDGRYHSKWLSMMYPRLFLSKNLLRDDGFFVISIDDSEAHNLRVLMNEVFGEENFIATLVWDRNRKNDAKYFSVGHEYMLVYAKNKSRLQELEVVLRSPKEGVDKVKELFQALRTEHADNWTIVSAELRKFFAGIQDDDPMKPLARYTKVDERGPYRDDGNINWPGGGGPEYDIYHPKTGGLCKKPRSGWRYPTEKRFWEEYDKGRIVFGEDESTVPSVRSNLFDSAVQVLPSVAYSYAQTASQLFDNIFDGQRVFDNPKPFDDMAKLVEYLTGPEDIILDFFAGSGSTGHGVVKSNYRSGAKRRFILVQLPEHITDDTSTGRNAIQLGFKCITDITRERMRRVFKEVSGESGGLELENPNIDQASLGFRVFSLASSNFKVWTGDADKVADLGQSLQLFADHVDADRKAEDILYELLLKAGFPLTAPVEKLVLAGKETFSVSDGALLICLDRELSLEVIEAMVEKTPSMILCLDEGFKGNDQLKVNAVQTVKSRNQNDETDIVFRVV